jgi:hypothetical protein
LTISKGMSNDIEGDMRSVATEVEVNPREKNGTKRILRVEGGED